MCRHGRQLVCVAACTCPGLARVVHVWMAVHCILCSNLLPVSSQLCGARKEMRNVSSLLHLFVPKKAPVEANPCVCASLRALQINSGIDAILVKVSALLSSRVAIG